MDEGESAIASESEMDLDTGLSGNFATPQTLEEYRTAFNKVKSQLIELQSETDQITDSTIKKQYEQLCDGIGRWIDDVDQDERRHFFKDQFSNILKKSPQEFSRLGLDQKDVTSGGKQWMDWLGKFDTCNSVIISLEIWRYLKDNIFDEKDRSYPLGIGKPGTIMFEEIHDVLKSKYQRKGNPRLADTWKSETLLAIVETAKFHEQVESEVIPSHSRDLLKALKIWISSNTAARHRKSLVKDVLRPACHLQSSMACSQSEYVWKTPQVERGRRPDLALAHTWTLRNVLFWRPAIYDDIEGVFHCLFPALYRRSQDNKDDQLVAKPIVLVYNSKTSQGPRPSSTHDELRNVDGQSSLRNEKAESSNVKSSGVLAYVKDKFLPSSLEQKPSASERDHRAGSPIHSSSSHERSTEAHSSRRKTSTNPRSRSRHRSRTLPALSTHTPTSRQTSDLDDNNSRYEDSNGREHGQTSYENIIEVSVYESSTESTHQQDVPPRSESPYPVDGYHVQVSPVAMDAGIRRNTFPLDESWRGE